MTPRDQQIVALLLRGCSNKEIANDLGIAEGTAKKHLGRTFLRFGIEGRNKRVKLAMLLMKNEICHDAEKTETYSQPHASDSSLSSSPRA